MTRSPKSKSWMVKMVNILFDQQIRFDHWAISRVSMAYPPSTNVTMKKQWSTGMEGGGLKAEMAKDASRMGAGSGHD